MHSEHFRDLFSKKLAPKGIYEYVIARTKFIDNIFQKALSGGFDQILIFGAGFDSRGIRFMKTQDRTRVFELDVGITQTAKLNQLKKRKITLPSNLIFIPIDFNKEQISEKLQSHGFQDQKRNLYILEGVIMYLNPNSVDQTFKVIMRGAGPGSEVVFDFISLDILKNEQFFRSIRKAGEGWTFGIPDEGIEQFLERYGFIIVKLLNSEVLEP